MLGNDRRLELLSNRDSTLEKYSGALQWLEVMLQNPECPTQEATGAALPRRHTAALADESGP